MRKVLLGLLLSLTSVSAFAGPDVDTDRNRNGDDVSVVIKFPVGHFWRHNNGVTYVRTPRVCNLSHVRLYITGDDLMIQDFDVMFGNGQTQDVAIREYFRENSVTAWKPLAGGSRCIVGFSIRATPDRDMNNAMVTLIGAQRRGYRTMAVSLGTARIRDFRY